MFFREEDLKEIEGRRVEREERVQKASFDTLLTGCL